jgi:hypothetical protein
VLCETDAVTIPDKTSRKRLLRRGFALEYTMLGWNVMGIVVLAITAISAYYAAREVHDVFTGQD